MALSVGSLFSGIGGIDLGLERAGMVTRWFCEIDPHCRNVLARHWPGLPIYGDITAVDWSGVERVDVLAGGFPCQPVSNAGKQLGAEDDRWLWPEFARAIRSLRPRYVLVENVAALLGRGFDEVITDLAALGYDAEWDCIPASAVGAPHLRDRLWTVAYADRSRPQGHGAERGLGQGGEQVEAGRSSHVPDATGQRPSRQGKPLSSVYPATASDWEATEPLNGRLADQWRVEPDVGRVANGVPNRVDRLRSLGNAVVPQIVEWIGRRLVAADERGASG